MSLFPLPIHVNVIWDPTLGQNLHTLWGPPPAIPPLPNTPIPSFEMITTQMWTAGFLLGQNKFTNASKPVLHRGVFICIDDHDIGTLIPDITIPPVNVYYAIMWPFSSRKMVFNAATVKMNGKPTACSQIFPPLPMMTCGDPLTLPTARPLINWMNNLTVGLTFADFLMGLARIAVSIAIDAIFEWVPFKNFLGNIGGRLARLGGRPLAALRRLGNSAIDVVANRMSWTAFAITRAALGKLGLDPSTFAKKATSSLAGWGLSAADSSWRGVGNPTLAYKVLGGPLPEISLFEVGGDPDDGRGSSVEGMPTGGTADVGQLNMGGD
ncbi:MAG: hypothetical protein L3J24_07745 [Xanthomonadales bacterium]|nr:hypothetical protein [Xanthomonadales bacterium]